MRFYDVLEKICHRRRAAKRALSRQCGFSVGYLSSIISGKVVPPPGKLIDMISGLKLNNDEIKEFVQAYYMLNPGAIEETEKTLKLAGLKGLEHKNLISLQWNDDEEIQQIRDGKKKYWGMRKIFEQDREMLSNCSRSFQEKLYQEVLVHGEDFVLDAIKKHKECLFRNSQSYGVATSDWIDV